MAYKYQDSKSVPPIEIKPHPDYIISPGPSLEQDESENGEDGEKKDCGCGCGGKCKSKKRIKIVAGIILLVGITCAIYFVLKK